MHLQLTDTTLFSNPCLFLPSASVTPCTAIIYTHSCKVSDAMMSSLRMVLLMINDPKLFLLCPRIPLREQFSRCPPPFSELLFRAKPRGESQIAKPIPRFISSGFASREGIRLSLVCYLTENQAISKWMRTTRILLKTKSSWYLLYVTLCHCTCHRPGLTTEKFNWIKMLSFSTLYFPYSPLSPLLHWVTSAIFY